MQKPGSDVSIKLCVNCFLCKTKQGWVYCKKGCFKEKIFPNKSIIYTPMDFDCEFYEE
jgi:hypothetical protein